MNVITGAGFFVALSALPMIAGLLLTESPLALRLRRLAMLLAIVLPAIFMAIAVIVAIQQNGLAFADFHVNYSAAMTLYANGIDPYSVHAAYSFPFPSFFFYWLFSDFGALSEPLAWLVWWIVNAAVWAGCVYLLYPTLPRLDSTKGRDTLLYVMIAIPAMSVLWQGQTAIFILAGLVALHLALIGRVPLWVGSAGLAFATLIKPQLALVGTGLALWVYLRARRPISIDSEVNIWKLLAYSVGIALAIIALTLIIPGGASFDTYRAFITEALPQVARPDDNINVIGSPAFVAGVVALGAGTSIAGIVSTIVTLLVLLAAAYWTFRHLGSDVTTIAAGWGVWAMVAPRVAWTWYAAWCLPFFALFIIAHYRQRRPAFRVILLVLMLAVLNLQLESILVNAVAIGLLIWLLWTAFEQDRINSHV